MGFPFAGAFRALKQPRTAFTGPVPSLGKALWGMMATWVPLALVNALGLTWQGLASYERFRHGELPSWAALLAGQEPGNMQTLLHALPPPPSIGRMWPWLLLVVPVGVLGTWMHHAVWDHTSLWLLGGLREKRGFRVTLIAEAEALRIAAVGTLIGCLSFLPGVGSLLFIPLLGLGVYLWLFRGFALAARHGCEPWRGVAATVVHALLLGGCAVFYLVVLMVLLGTAS
jgi:hypothetical protein